MTRARTIVWTILMAIGIVLFLAVVAHAQPVLSSPTCDVSWTQTWIESVDTMQYPKLSFYVVEFAPRAKGPWSAVTFVVVDPIYGQPVNGVYTARCPGYIPSGAYFLRIAPWSVGGWKRGKYTPPVMGTLDRGE